MPFSMIAVFRNFLPCIRKNLLQRISVDPQLRYPFSQMKRNVTLQVRILLKKIKKSVFASLHGKRAFFSASFLPGPDKPAPQLCRLGKKAADKWPKRAVTGRTGIRASLTLEAALGLSLFIFAAVCMLLPMRVMHTERKLQAAMEALGEEFSRYAYIKDAVEQSKPLSRAGTGAFAKAFCQNLTSGAAKGYGMVLLSAHRDTSALEGMTLERTRILEEGEMIQLVLDYEIRLPFPVLGLPALKRTATCSRRAWVGLAGKEYDGEGNRTDDPDEIVYVGKNSTRYHRSRECHYLSNQLRTVPLASVEEERNQGGAKYHPCAVCGSQAGAYVYILPSGKSYHSSASCRAILAYVKAVRLSQVAHLGACSYCGK